MEVMNVLGIKGSFTVGEVEVILQPKLLAVAQGKDLLLVLNPGLAPGPQSDGVVRTNVPGNKDNIL